MANEKRLIDANALKSQITRYHMSLTPRYISKLVDAEIGDVIDILDESPTVDAVEVVRCKDCIMLSPEEIRKAYNAGNFCMRTGLIVGDNDFCSYGERKNNDCK